ncbi:acyltransferase family protein [Enterobacter kobei]|uniref:acyltransferase family protein n=1 Tax=Enterobacter kobei TaxID=208224 RepID=UPI0004A0D811|nr:acyltransferase family protein [Enterobacter kobei]KDF45014.1 hypothetical protein AE42_01701 [Enterobacter kobei]MCE1263362.1 acyltransferase [Enterobacter kobei]MCE1359149.1 acyltransferase [Enterobacter kobei]
MKFRKDINGLRAFAVLAVMIYHFRPEWVPGGFAGVDVFFVISGYLMTGIIFSSIETKRFNLLGFYVARVNRIVPALTVLCAVLLIIGWFVLVPVDYRTLGKHIASSLLFFSNIIYWLEAGYFDVNSHEKLLLHTWSLSVEWQFYIIYPVIFVFLTRVFTLHAIKKIVAFLTVGFFFVNIYMTQHWPDAAYFLLPSRVWEMLLGGIAFLYPLGLSTKLKNGIEKVGLALIICSFFFMNSKMAWPGYYALLPALGAFLIIQGDNESSIATNNPFSQFLGKISYSVYLWHWPFVALSYYYDISNAWVLGVPISILLGYLSYNYIESVKWQHITQWKSTFKLKPLIIAAFVVFGASFTYAKNGIIDRYPENRVLVLNALLKNITMPLRENGYCFYSFNDSQSLKVDRNAGTQCFLGVKTEKAETLIFGDSFAGQYDPFWNFFAKEHNISIQSVSTNWCFPSFNEDYTGNKAHVAFKQCLENRMFLKDSIQQKKYKYLILASDWNAVYSKGYIEGFNRVVDLAVQNNIKVILVSAPTLYRKNPLNKFQRYILSDGDLNIRDLEVAENGNAYIAKKYLNNPDVFYISKEDLYNSTGLFVRGGYAVPYSLDGMHISLMGAIKSYEHFRDSPDKKKLDNYMHLANE